MLDAHIVGPITALVCFLLAEGLMYRFAGRRGMAQAQVDFRRHEQEQTRLESMQILARKEEQYRLRVVVSALLLLVTGLQEKLSAHDKGCHAWYCEAVGKVVEFVHPSTREVEVELAALTRAMKLLDQMESIEPRDIEQYMLWVDAAYWRFARWEREARCWLFFDQATFYEVTCKGSEQWSDVLTFFGTPSESAVGALVELLQESIAQYQQGLRHALELFTCPERSWHKASKSFSRALSHWSKGQALALMLAHAGRQDETDLADPWTAECYSFQFTKELERRIFEDLCAMQGAYLCLAQKRLSSL